MPIFLLLAFTLSALGSWRFSGRVLGEVPGAERVAAAVVLWIFGLLFVLRLAGIGHVLSAPWLTMMPIGFGVFAIYLGRRVPSVPITLGRHSMLGRLGLVALSTVFLLLFLQAWLYRSTAWDALWYHALMTHNYVVQGSTEWLEVGVDYASGYPNGVELLAAWPCTILGTTTFDDVGQVPFGIAGAALVVAWAQRCGAHQHTAVVAAAMWVAMPPVLLQMTSDLNDVAEAVALAATVWFLFVGQHTATRSWWVLMSASLAFAVKGSGIVMLAPLAPFLVVNQLRASFKGRWWLEIPVRTALLACVGLYKPIENWLHNGNPFWPLANERLGFEGPVDPASFTWNGMHGLDCFFFTGEGDFLRMIGSWYDLAPGYEPNMTSGGFGPVHAFLAVPAVLAAGVLLYRKRIAASQRWPLAMVLGLFVLGLMGPNPWWPRHILASSLASMVLLGAMFARLPRRLELGLTSLALTGALAFAGVAASQGIDGYREHGWVEPIRIGAAARSALASGPLWPAEMIEERNATFGHDDVFAYERAVWLPAQFTPWDFGSRVIWIEPEGSAADYLVRLRGANARWVVLRSARWRAGLIALGAQEVYRHNDEVVLDLSEIPTE